MGKRAPVPAADDIEFAFVRGQGVGTERVGHGRSGLPGVCLRIVNLERGGGLARGRFSAGYVNQAADHAGLDIEHGGRFGCTCGPCRAVRREGQDVRGRHPVDFAADQVNPSFNGSSSRPAAGTGQGDLFGPLALDGHRLFDFGGGLRAVRPVQVDRDHPQQNGQHEEAGDQPGLRGDGRRCGGRDGSVAWGGRGGRYGAGGPLGL